MTSQPAPADIQKVSRSLARVLREPDDDQATAPLRAGMRARAIADACAKLGLAAILIDATGRVLHVGPAAAVLLKGDLALAAGHLVGSSRLMNRAVQRAVMAALGTSQDEGDASPASAAVTITGLQYRDPSPFQLLRGVLVLGRKGDRLHAGLASLQGLLAPDRVRHRGAHRRRGASLAA